jgi:hypothetical protein
MTADWAHTDNLQMMGKVDAAIISQAVQAEKACSDRPWDLRDSHIQLPDKSHVHAHSVRSALAACALTCEDASVRAAHSLPRAAQGGGLLTSNCLSKAVYMRTVRVVLW